MHFVAVTFTSIDRCAFTMTSIQKTAQFLIVHNPRVILVGENYGRLRVNEPEQ